MKLKPSITRGPLLLIFCGIAIYLLIGTWNKGRKGQIVFPANPTQSGTWVVLAQGDHFELARVGLVDAKPYTVSYRTLMVMLAGLTILGIVDTYVGARVVIRRGHHQ